MITRNYKVYLAGPISGLTYKKANSWREYVNTRMPEYIGTYSPMRAKDFLNQQNEHGVIQDCYEESPLASKRGIITRDYYDCRTADAIFVNLQGAVTVSIGTVMEIAWAKAFNIPCVIITDKEGNLHDHSMVDESTGYKVYDINEGIEILIALLSSDNQLKERAAPFVSTSMTSTASEEVINTLTS